MLDDIILTFPSPSRANKIVLSTLRLVLFPRFRMIRQNTESLRLFCKTFIQNLCTGSRLYLSLTNETWYLPTFPLYILILYGNIKYEINIFMKTFPSVQLYQLIVFAEKSIDILCQFWLYLVIPLINDKILVCRRQRNSFSIKYSTYHFWKLIPPVLGKFP